MSEVITLSVAGLKFETSFKTVVGKVTSPDENSSITLDSFPNMSISGTGYVSRNNWSMIGYKRGVV